MDTILWVLIIIAILMFWAFLGKVLFFIISFLPIILFFLLGLFLGVSTGGPLGAIIIIGFFFLGLFSYSKWEDSKILDKIGNIFQRIFPDWFD